MVVKAYCDGGCSGRNPSSIGGTYAYCFVDENDEKVYQDFGFITPEELGVSKISNNISELYAAIMCLRELPSSWSGTLYTDSRVTLLRLGSSIMFNGIPEPLRQETLSLRRARTFKVVLVKGHPTLRDLERGRDSKGRLVSKWNVYVDKLCNQANSLYLKGKLKC